MKAVNIKWDTDGDMELLKKLPNEMDVPDGLTDDGISDYLSEVTGFCHHGFELKFMTKTKSKMTENEALKYLKNAKRTNDMLCILPKSDIGDCIIKALEELQQYREIGTVDECRAAMEKQKEMIAYCNEKESFDCLFYNASKKYNKCTNDFIAEECERRWS